MPFSVRSNTVPSPHPLQPRRKIGPTAMKTASGIPCWPSRDPIGEKGGMNLYEFVGNDGVDGWDMLGKLPIDGVFPSRLPTSTPASSEPDKSGKCVCGPDITDALKATLDDVAKKFAALEPSDRKAVCDGMVNPLAPVAWDITDLKAPVGASLHLPNLCGHKDSANSDKCKLTITINGECHFGGAVNYALYGLVNKLCGTRRETALGWVALWKTKQNFSRLWPHNTFHASSEWTKTAYAGWLSDRDFLQRLETSNWRTRCKNRTERSREEREVSEENFYFLPSPPSRSSSSK